MALVDPDEVITLITLVLPGFVSLSLTLQSVGIARKVEFSEYVVWSFFISGVVDLALVVGLGMPIPPSSDQFLGALLSWFGALVYSLLIVAVGLAGGLLLRFDIGRRLRSLIWFKSKIRRIPSLVWDDALSAHFDQWVIAETADGREIYGLLVRHSTGSEPREVYLLQPKLVTYDDQGKSTRTPMGEAVLIAEESLRSLRFLMAPSDLTLVLPAGDPRYSSRR